MPIDRPIPREAPPMHDVRCGYYAGPAIFNPRSDHVYQRDYGPIWHCVPCKAWVNCHKGTMTPLGRLANAVLRGAKIRTHAAFDPFWQAKMRRNGLSKRHARGKGYAWLAAQLGIPPADCHIGMFDEAECARVVEVCEAARASLRRVRERADA